MSVPAMHIHTCMSVPVLSSRHTDAHTDMNCAPHTRYAHAAHTHQLHPAAPHIHMHAHTYTNHHNTRIRTHIELPHSLSLARSLSLSLSLSHTHTPKMLANEIVRRAGDAHWSKNSVEALHAALSQKFPHHLQGALLRVRTQTSNSRS